MKKIICLDNIIRYYTGKSLEKAVWEGFSDTTNFETKLVD